MKNLIRFLAASLLFVTAAFAQLGVAIRTDLASDPADTERNSEAAAYWATPDRQDRLNVEGAALIVRLNGTYVPTAEEGRLVNRWFRFGNGRPSTTVAQKQLLAERLWASPNPGVRAEGVQRAAGAVWNAEAYAAWKAAGFVYWSVPFSADDPDHGDMMVRYIGERAATYGDWAVFNTLDRSRLMGWPFSSDSYRRWLRHVGTTATTDQARYDLIQQEMAMVLLAPDTPVRRQVMEVLQTSSDLYFTRLRRAQMLTQ